MSEIDMTEVPFGATFFKEEGLSDEIVDLVVGAPGKRFLVEGNKLMQKATSKRLVRIYGRPSLYIKRPT